MSVHETPRLTLPAAHGEPPVTCPKCGGRARIHARVLRAVHDWETTMVDCLRLRCCGTTFTSTPPGLRPRARYSTRVVALTRALVAAGLSRRRCVRLLKQVRVPVTVESVRTWSADVEAETTSTVHLGPEPLGDIAVQMRRDLWLAIHSPQPDAVLDALQREAGSCRTGGPALPCPGDEAATDLPAACAG